MDLHPSAWSLGGPILCLCFSVGASAEPRWVGLDHRFTTSAGGEDVVRVFRREGAFPTVGVGLLMKPFTTGL